MIIWLKDCALCKVRPSQTGDVLIEWKYSDSSKYARQTEQYCIQQIYHSLNSVNNHSKIVFQYNASRFQARSWVDIH